MKLINEYRGLGVNPARENRPGINARLRVMAFLVISRFKD
jgi:hypothetical protein